MRISNIGSLLVLLIATTLVHSLLVDRSVETVDIMEGRLTNLEKMVLEGKSLVCLYIIFGLMCPI